MVKEDKYSHFPWFRNELVDKSAEVLLPLISEHGIEAITCVPSLRSNIVEDFTKQLAEKCGVEFVSTLAKRESAKQKTMKNSSHQCENAFGSFFVECSRIPTKVILVDDIIDSGWTLTVCGYKLMEAGCKKVYPFTLACSTTKEG